MPNRQMTATHNGRHGEALEEEPFAVVAVALKDEEVSVGAHFTTNRPAQKKTKQLR